MHFNVKPHCFNICLHTIDAEDDILFSFVFRVHRQIVTVFGSGIEDMSEQKCCFRK